MAKEIVSSFLNKINNAFALQFGFDIKEFSLNRLVQYMYKPTDASSLAVTRILFGLAMLFDIVEERGGAMMLERWGDPRTCHFPLLPFITSVAMPYMALVYTGLWLGALGIMLGYKYRLSTTVFAASYWYLLLIEKSLLNNHSYLFGLVSLLLIGTQANCYWSLDVYLSRVKRSKTVPYWNYFVLKYQFFILYFLAGIKKGTAEWLSGYSVPDLSMHWVFTPFRLFLTSPQIDYLIVHWFVFLFDLTIAFWMMWSRTRHVAMIFCAAFHLMNIRLFRIGMFPWVCLATMPLFYPFNWPHLVIDFLKNIKEKLKAGMPRNTVQEEENDNNGIVEGEPDKTIEETIDPGSEANTDEQNDAKDAQNNKRRKLTVTAIIIYMLLQGFLPFSHFITKGYNTWTSGLYGYSWDMMVYTWHSDHVVVNIVNNHENTKMYIDPYIWTLNDRWTKHADMVYQYARCLKNNVLEELRMMEVENIGNMSVYVDIWWSMNGRFQQRMFDSKVDLLAAKWSPFEQPEWVMPLLYEADNWREELQAIKKEVHTWNKHSEVLFFADFPGYRYEKVLPENVYNVTLTNLQGDIALESESKEHSGYTYRLRPGEHIAIQNRSSFSVVNIGDKPAYYMYIFATKDDNDTKMATRRAGEMFPIAKEFLNKLIDAKRFFELVFTSLYQLFFRMSVPALVG